MKNNGSTTKKRASKRELTPKLRFPEFRDVGEWEQEELQKVAIFINEKLPLEQLILANYVSTENILPDYKGIATASKLPALGSATRFKVNDILVSNIRPYLKKVWFSNMDGAASNDVIVMRAKEKVKEQYLACMLRNDAFIDYVMRGAKGVKMPRGDTLLMRKYLLAYPSDKKEQQKIADCLFSVDELIAAQAQKIGDLKEHKGGLMQILFPAEGETLPKLRFPEFQNAGEWDVRNIGDKDFAFLYKGKGISKSDIDVNGKTPCIRYGELYTRYNEIIDTIFSKTNCPTSDLFLSKKNDVIIPASGETKIDIATASCVTIENVALGSDLNIIRSCHNGIFISYYLNGPLKREIAQVAQGNSVVHLYPSQLGKFKILIPKGSEQQKIADCLSSIDELITAQVQKLEALKKHKKGLMQQIFPAVNEVTG